MIVSYDHKLWFISESNRTGTVGMRRFIWREIEHTIYTFQLIGWPASRSGRKSAWMLRCMASRMVSWMVSRWPAIYSNQTESRGVCITTFDLLNLLKLLSLLNNLKQFKDSKTSLTISWRLQTCCWTGVVYFSVRFLLSVHFSVHVAFGSLFSVHLPS